MITDDDIKKLSEVFVTKGEFNELKGDVAVLKHDVSDLKEDVGALKENMQSLLVTVDGIAKMMETFLIEQKSMGAQVGRHDAWIQEAAPKAGVPVKI